MLIATKMQLTIKDSAVLPAKHDHEYNINYLKMFSQF